MTSQLVIGVTPGLYVGIASLWLTRSHEHHLTVPTVCEVSFSGALPFVQSLLPRDRRARVTMSYGTGSPPTSEEALQITEHVRRNLEILGGDHGVVVSHPAEQILAWCTQERLRLTRLHEMTRRYPLARSAAQQALYAAVHDCGVPDPMKES